MAYTRQIIIILLASIAVMLLGCQDRAGKTNDTGQPMEVTVSHPLQKTIVDWDEYTGRFQATEKIEIRARVSGYLDAIKFQDGQKVKQGDILFVIDQRPFLIAYNQARAEYNLALKEYNRAQKLWKTRSIAESVLDLRAQEYQIAKAKLDQTRLNLEFTQVKSPIDGRIGRHLVSEGNLISGDTDTSATNATLLTTVVATDPIHFYFEASEHDLLKYIRFGQTSGKDTLHNKTNPILIKLQDEEEFTHRGTVDFIDNEVDFDTGTIQGRAVLPNPNDVIQPGLFGRAKLSASGAYPAILIPDAVIGTEQSRKFVYIVNDNNEIEKRIVTLGPLHDKNFRVIRSGLSVDDKVVTKGIQRVRAGMSVNPKMEELTQQ
jgi:RND family efflux transporter MFP subunit